MKKEITGQKIGNIFLTFTVAECGEYHSLGKFYEGIGTLEEAIKLYLQIPPGRRHGIPAIGINIHVEGTDRVQDSQADILSGSEIDAGVTSLMPEIYENPQVLKEVNRIVETMAAYFPTKEIVDY